jgi:hypothetical protein
MINSGRTIQRILNVAGTMDDRGLQYNLLHASLQYGNPVFGCSERVRYAMESLGLATRRHETESTAEVEWNFWK